MLRLSLSTKVRRRVGVPPKTVADAVRDQKAIVKETRGLLKMNQPHGFDCPGSAWPDPKHTSSFEFCE
jgi:hypothetical protein